MTREIKFRAWDKKTKKIRKVNSIAFHTDESYGSGKTDNTPKVINLWGRDIIEDKDIILHREEDDVELMQYTGLKDKNGKEIYEEDIMEFEWGRWKKKEYGVVGISQYGVNFNECTAYLRDGGIHGVVIGNKFKNPDLIPKD